MKKSLKILFALAIVTGVLWFAINTMNFSTNVNSQGHLINLYHECQDSDQEVKIKTDENDRVHLVCE